jgi:hypothetical protein
VAGQGHLTRLFAGTTRDRVVVATMSSELFWIVQLPAGIWHDAVIVGVTAKLLNVTCAVTVPPLDAESAGGVAVMAGVTPVPRSGTSTGVRFDVMVSAPFAPHQCSALFLA